VALGDLESLRGLPFRLMIVAGLDERAFPGRDAADDLDLRGRGRRPGDVPASERDRYLFLEALLSARERFVASFVARDPLTLEARQPSPVVLDLLEAAAAAARVPEEALVRAHPLLRWDPRRFAGDHPLLPVQPSVHLEARAELRYRHPPAAEPPPPDPALEPAPPWPGPALRPAVVPMGLHHLEAFLRSPLQGAARFALGLRDEEEDPGDMEEEAAAMAGLHAVPMLREAFWSARAGAGTPDQAYRRGRETFERAGLAPLGLLSGPERERHRRILEAWSAQVPETVPVRFPRLGPAALAPRGLPAEDLGVLTVPVRLGPGLVVELRGALAPQGDLGSGPGSVLLLTDDSATPKAAAHHLVKAWVAHLVLAARAGTALAPRGYLVAGRAPRNGVRSVAFDALDAAGALDLLARLLADLLDHPHDTLLPLEALLELQDPADLPDWLEARAGREHGGYACLRGPVPNPGTFPPADAAAVARRMELLDPFLRALR
jgi:hypothetical protein